MPDIKVETFHLSCASDLYEAGKNYAIMYIYTMGNYDAKANKPHRKILPGYVVMKKVESLPKK